MKKVMLILAGVLVAAGVLLLAWAFLTSDRDFGKLGGAQMETNTYTVTETFDKLDIRSIEGGISLKPSADGSVRVVCVEREKVRHTVRVEDGTLKVTVTDEREWYERWSFFGKEQSVAVWLPAGQYASLTIDTRTGAAEVPADFSFGAAEVTLTTGSASWEADVAGRLRITAGTGSVTVRNIRAERVDLKTTTGRVTAESVVCSGDMSASISTGRTVLTDVSCRNLVSDGSTGDLVMKNVTASETFSLERSTGDIRLTDCDAAEISIKTSTGNVEGSLRTGKNFRTKTSTGSVRVPDPTGGGKCEISTSTGNIRISISGK